MVCEESLNLLALARSDNSIEVWNLSHSPYIERTFVGTCGTVEDLAWFNKRLFSGGLQGSVIEHDLCSQTAKRFHPVTSGACWCIAVEKNRKQLAAGTEDGYINIIDISDDDMVYNRLLDRQEGRILCLKWDSTGNQIVTGSVDTVRVWNVQTGHAIHRMNTGRAADNAPTIVWSLDVTKDLTIATGDSRGMLCLWDGKTGMSLTTFHSHKADILSVCFDDTQQTVYCAGIDPLIVSFEKLKMRRGETKWAQGPHRSIHDHDVRCLNFCNGKLYSAGVDSYLAMSSFPPKLLLKFPPLLQPPTVSIADDMLILLRYPAHLELWRLASCRDETPVQLLRWQPPSEYHIKCAQISKDSKWLACSTLDRFRLYSIHYVCTSMRFIVI
ncbi:hypothetical protein AAG570_013414 [Ranatra chinensis]|uniref:Uncharacterized protein n=1 Tax=Ranatra chinensis TaxID=642074 RepID=A0ABD0YC40_9HEMI